MLVRMWMTRKIVSVAPDIPILEAREIMAEKRVRRLLVLKQDELAGIITQGDIHDIKPSQLTSLSIWKLSYLLARATVEDVMTKDVITVSPKTTIEEAALTMREKKVGGLPVVEDGKLVGIITESDIFGAFCEVMGVKKGGTRLTIQIENKPGAIAGVLNIIEKYSDNLLSIVTCEKCRPGPEQDIVVIRIQNDNRRVVHDLRGDGLDVLDVHWA